MPLSPTPGHGLQRYATGENPGSAGLNFNWGEIDTLLMGIGTSFPSPYPVDGPFLRSDENILYQNTGTLDTPVWTVLIGGATDATTLVKGILKLAGDLAGTADAPTVPGLAGKSDVGHTHPESDIVGLVAFLATLAPPKYIFTSPDGLTTLSADNTKISLLPGNGLPISNLEADVKTAPTDADIHVDFYVGTRSGGPGSIGASIGQVVIAAGTFTGSLPITPLTILKTEFLIIKITQVGSTIAGSDLTASAW